MPEETQQAIEWALQQEYEIESDLVKVSEVFEYMPFTVVDKVREYFNENNIEYSTFSYDDLIPYLKDMGLLN